MRIRHVTAADNVDQAGYLIDPRAVAHGVIVAGRMAALAGPIDPLTHLNQDFPDHGLEQCVVAERLEVGAAVRFGRDGLLVASAAPSAYRPLGRVDLDERLSAWRAALSVRRAGS